MTLPAADISSKINDIFETARAGKLTPEEQSWVSKIESLRSEVDSSRTTIPPNKKIFLIPLVNLVFQTKALFRKSTSQMSVGEMARKSSLSPEWGQMLFHLVRYAKPAKCLELGTCVGISGAYLAAALELNQKGELITLEKSLFLSCRAKRNFRKLGLKRAVIKTGEFQNILPGVLSKHAPFDFVFIDGHHDKSATIHCFNQIAPFLTDPSLVMLDDIRWSEEMFMAWQEIKKHEHVFVGVDLSRMGVCVLSRACGSPTIPDPFFG